MWVEPGDDIDVMNSILDSVRVVPPGYTALPVDANGTAASTQRAMLEAGLTVEVVDKARPGLSPGVLLNAEPPLGTIVPVGSNVTLTVSR